MDNSTFEFTPDPWSPHVYIMRCVVNAALLAHGRNLLSASGIAEPPWMTAVRLGGSHSAGEHERDLRSLPFVKVGSSYQKDPSIRTRRLSKPEEPSATMTCLGVPVIGKRVVCYVPGGQALETALHGRWASDRIDPSREFFWINDEMRELAAAYVGYVPPGAGVDPLSGEPWVWRGEPARSNAAEMGVSE